VGKLVLYLADGSPHEIPLAKERITIGRRADNDVCLPYPAVSGEHAVVMTILADSFLEDQGSTNGTLVNGRPIGKHFLRDRDVIDIGRQRIVYLADDAAFVEPISETVLHREVPGLTERVPRAPPPAKDAPARDGGGRTPAPAGSGAPTAPPAPPRSAPALPARVETSRYDDILLGVENPAVRSAAPTAAASAPLLHGDELASLMKPPRSRRSAGAKGERGPRTETAAAPEEAIPAVDGKPQWVLQVLTGPSAGRSLSLSKPEVILGRIGVQVAALRIAEEELRLVSLEGADPIRLNGANVPPAGMTLKSGDVFDVAGTRIEVTRK
jgi:hypothetical protein